MQAVFGDEYSIGERSFTVKEKVGISPLIKGGHNL
jgi:hypothetical protein